MYAHNIIYVSYFGEGSLLEKLLSTYAEKKRGLLTRRETNFELVRTEDALRKLEGVDDEEEDDDDEGTYVAERVQRVPMDH